MYSIIDIETTGGSATNSRITEIAIYIFDRKRIVKEYQSLINPCRQIPYNITKLTGITDEMVAEAPLFKDIAEEILKITNNQIFVAHNVNFDYNFIKAEFNRIGIQFRRKKLCTVRLSRKILPGKLSYSLGRLCESLGISLNNRHRAAGDAHATTLLFELLLQKDNQEFITNSLKSQSLEALLPPNMPKSDFMALPEKQGIYYFLNQKKEIVYIGKAKNIKKRVHSHFSGNSNTGSKNYFVKNVFGLNYQEIENELLVDIIEATEIKKHWPRYNRSMKRVTLNYGLFRYEDRNGYLRFNIGRSGKFDKPIIVFKSQAEIKHFLKELVFDYQLCPRLSGLQPIGSGRCNYIEEFECEGACCGNECASDYNKRVNKAIEERVIINSSFMIKEPLKNNNENAVVLVEKGRYKGYGKIKKSVIIDTIDELKPHLNSAYDDQDMSILIHSYLNKTKSGNIHFFK